MQHDQAISLLEMGAPIRRHLTPVLRLMDLHSLVRCRMGFLSLAYRHVGLLRLGVGNGRSDDGHRGYG